VYHYGAHDDGLRRLRAGDFRRVLVEATGGEPAVAAAPVVAVCTSTFWRNAWKYRARAYRHSYWDSGTILANTLAPPAAGGPPARPPPPPPPTAPAARTGGPPRPPPRPGGAGPPAASPGSRSPSGSSRRCSTARSGRPPPIASIRPAARSATPT